MQAESIHFSARSSNSPPDEEHDCQGGGLAVRERFELADDQDRGDLRDIRNVAGDENHGSAMIRTMVQAQSACLSPACLSSQYSEATTLSSVREFIVWSQQWQDVRLPSVGKITPGEESKPSGWLPNAGASVVLQF